jgi:hypothetical protein
VLLLAHPAFAAQDIKTKISTMPSGATIEVRLKNSQTLRGSRGDVSDSAFTLLDPGGSTRQLTFDEVRSVKLLGKQSHTTRNVLIIVGVGVVAAVAAIAIYAKRCPLGCH